MKLSIVSTLYKSAPYIEEFHRRSTASARGISGDDYEIVLVNDGSPDVSLDIAVRLAERDPHVVVVDLSRNFGHHRAMMTGLTHSKGDLIFLIDSDLEEDPEWLLSFEKQMHAEACDVVYGVQAKRRGGLVYRATGMLYYKLFRFFTGLAQPDNGTTARLMSRRYVDAVLLHQEREVNIGGLWVLAGFAQSPQVVTKHLNNPTTYSFARKLDHVVTGVTSFSSLPLVFIFYCGLAISLSAVAFIAYLIIQYFIVAMPPSGYTSIIASIWLFSGIIILFVGLEGIYIAKVFTEVKQRPYTIVRHVYRHSQNNEH